MRKQKMAATVIGQSVIHVTPHVERISVNQRILHDNHLIGELKLLTEDRRILYVRCPTKDGCIVIDEKDTPDHKLGMQLYNSIVCKHPFGSRRVVRLSDETYDGTPEGRPVNRYVLSDENPEVLVRPERHEQRARPPEAERPAPQQVQRPQRPPQNQQPQRPPQNQQPQERQENTEQQERPAVRERPSRQMFNQQLAQKLALFRQRSAEAQETPQETPQEEPPVVSGASEATEVG